MLKMTRPRNVLLHPFVLVPLGFLAGMIVQTALAAQPAPLQFTSNHEMVMVVVAQSELDERRSRVSVVDSSGERITRLAAPKTSANVIPMTAR